MHTLYNIFLRLAQAFIPITKYFNSKMKSFVEGRKTVFDQLRENRNPQAKTIWVHAASLGEFEQGVPIMERLQQDYPEYRILVSFFSPSGYEVKKNNPFSFLSVYLPLDTPKNARKFVELAQPQLALFIKYEVWPNYLFALENQNIPVLLVSGNFRKDQIYFKAYGEFMKKALNTFKHLFVQTGEAEKILLENGIPQTSISGDTRFDRVSKQLKMDNHLPEIEAFKGDKICLIGGSTWPEDEDLLMDFLNKAPKNLKIILAPHQIKHEQIEKFRKRLNLSSVLYSERAGKDLESYSVFIIDTVGLLTRIYSYGDLAYVGGAAGTTGLHNILEPAAFGLPIIIGKNHENFPEAAALQKYGGLFSVDSPAAATKILTKLTEDHDFRKNTGARSAEFIRNNTGATQKIMDFIEESALLH